MHGAATRIKYLCPLYVKYQGKETLFSCLHLKKIIIDTVTDVSINITIISEIL